MKPLIFDWGLNVELALRLARELSECSYFSPWASSFPKPDDQLIGTGLEDFGVTRVDFPFELVGSGYEPGLFVFPDLYFADTQSLLRRAGKEVWGSGWGELLELDRWKLYGLLEDNGWPMTDLDRINGIRALEKELRTESEHRFVKIAPYFRGITETYEHRGWPASRTWFEKLRADLGPHGDDMNFMLQSPVPGEHVVEPGVDPIIINGAIQYPTMVGWEKKGSALITKVVDEIPEILAGPIETVVKALGQYTNFFSAELRVNEDGEVHFIDATCRMPRPGDGAHLELISNLGAVMTGNEKPKMAAKYACQIMLDASQAEKRPLHIAFPEEIRDNVKLYWFFRDKDGEYWTLPHGITNVVSVVCVGDDLEDVKKQCLEYAEEVKADGISFEKDAFDSIEKDIEQGEFNGIDWN